MLFHAAPSRTDRKYLGSGTFARAFVLSATAALSSSAGVACSRDAADVVRRYSAPEATQGVAVDDTFFYAIGSAEIGKYEKSTGRRVGRWAATTGGPITHLNGGVVLDGQLFCAHSNYPHTPMVSSIEVFDTATFTHMRRIPLPSGLGSATWLERTTGDWWIAFAHYSGPGGEPGRGSEYTRLVRFDSQWKQTGTWSFPAAVVSRWDGMSTSGGVFAAVGRLYTTGHHAPELYVLDVPDSGTELVLRAIVPTASEGQGIGLDRATGLLYSIQRDSREVIVSRIPPDRL
jgi:hypothetical protein